MSLPCQKFKSHKDRVERVEHHQGPSSEKNVAKPTFFGKANWEPGNPLIYHGPQLEGPRNITPASREVARTNSLGNFSIFSTAQKPSGRGSASPEILLGSTGDDHLMWGTQQTPWKPCKEWPRDNRRNNEALPRGGTKGWLIHQSTHVKPWFKLFSRWVSKNP